MFFLIGCDNANLGGSYTLCVYSTLHGAYWVKSINPFKPVSVRALCAIADGFLVILETKDRSFALARLSDDFSLKKAVVIPSASSVRAVTSNDNHVYIAADNSILRTGLDLIGPFEPVYTSPSTFLPTGICFSHQTLAITESNFLNQGAIRYIDGTSVRTTLCEPWNPALRNDELTVLDARLGELVSVDSTNIRLDVKCGYPRVAVFHGNTDYVFFSTWRRYKRTNFFRGHWERVPDWVNGTEAIDYSSGFLRFAKGVHIETVLTAQFWSEISGAVMLPRFPSSRWIMQDNAGLAAQREKLFLDRIGSLRKKVIVK